MRFLMVSNYGEGAHILHTIKEEGNEVELYIEQEDHKQAWDGLLPKVDSVKPAEGTVVIFDFSGFGDLADKLRADGIFTVGGSKLADKLEQDRMFGLNFMEEAGIKVPFTANFKGFSVEEIRIFLKEQGEGKRWAFKPSGKDIPCYLTYCAHDDADLLGWVEYCEKYHGKNIDEFVLQEFKEGVCVSSEFWCDGNKFVRPANHTVEVKKFMNDELGQATGCSGNIVWAERDETCRIINEGVGRLERSMVAAGHVGPVDLNVVANEEGIWGLEFTCRFGYCATPTLAKMITGGVGQFFSDIARGQASKISMVESYGAGVRLSIPPYPVDGKLKDLMKVSGNVGIPIRNLPDDAMKQCHFYEVMLDGEDMVHAPGMGVIATVVGIGDDCESAFKGPYKLLEDVCVPNKQYRTDLARCLGEMVEEVEAQEKAGAAWASQ